MTGEKPEYQTTLPSIPGPEAKVVAQAAEPAAMVIYADRTEIRELADRIITMLPSAKELGQQGALALAQVAISMGLNPFIGEIWAWRNKDGTVTLMCGIKGLRRAAHEQARKDDGYYTVEFGMPTEDMLDGANVKPGDIARVCLLELWTETTRETFKTTGKLTVYTGLGIYRAGDKTRMEPVQVARKRAEADALKQAFDMPMVLAGEEHE